MTTLAAVWSAVGPLVGVLIGGWLTRSWQRRQWLLEGKKVEYREILSTLSNSYHVIRLHAPVSQPVFMSAEEDLKVSEAWLAGIKVIEDRIFIERKVREANILQLWLVFLKVDSQKLNAQWKDLHDTLVRMAHEDLGME